MTHANDSSRAETSTNALEMSGRTPYARRDRPERTADASEAEPPEEPDDLGFLEVLLRDDEHLDEILLRSEGFPATLRRLLAVAIVGLAAHGVVVGLVSETALPTASRAGIFNWYAAGIPALTVPTALTGAFLTATAVGLPSFYFYARLAGADVSFATVTAQAVRALARTSVALVGLLPFYAAVVLSSHLGFSIGYGVILWGLTVPFLAGLVGIWSVFSSFRRLLDDGNELEGMRMVERTRVDGVLAMVLGWGLLFTTVAPIAMWRYGEWLAEVPTDRNGEAVQIDGRFSIEPLDDSK